MLQSFVSKLFKNEIGWRYSRATAMEKRGKNVCFFLYCLFTRLHAAEFVLSRWKLSTRWSITALATIGLRSRNRINLRPTRLVSGRASEYRWWRRKYRVNPSSRGRGIARGVLRSSPKPENWDFLSPVFYRAAPKSLYQTPGQHPPRITHRIVNTVTRGWVGAPNERAPFRFHVAVVGFVDRCPTSARKFLFLFLF